MKNLILPAIRPAPSYLPSPVMSDTIFLTLPTYVQRAIDDAFDSIAVEEAGQIALDLIPSALQRLDLPPDDEDVLSIFRNAASGWTSSSIKPLVLSDSSGKYISRDDWRAVCAVLLENRPLEDVQSEDGSLDSGSDEYVERNGNSDHEDEFS